MGKIFTLKRLTLLMLVMAVCFTSYGQTTISGTIIEASSGEPLVGVNIVVKGKVIGTITDFDGNFELSTKEAPPLTLVFSIIGFAAQELDITQSNVQGLSISMEEQAFLGQEVVISASRVQESILESPVTIEKLDILAIQETAAPSFYEALGNLKGVDFSTQSLTFKSINTRGFGANGNTRFVQLIDGIDNQAPGLNFPVGNIVGINDLDLESAELIPGAASALYGPNAIQGILLLNSKSPFEYQGLSAYSKTGLNHVDEEDDDLAFYQDYGIRYAKAFNNKFAFKVTASYLQAEDFRGVDERDQFGGVVEAGEDGRSPGNRTFDGVNVYGDFAFDPNIVLGETFNSFFPNLEDRLFSPTGYSESSFVDNTTESIKLGGALHYRLNDNLEAIGQFNWGSGSTVYTANDRFVLDGFRIYTAKLELRNPNWYVRAYTTQEASGDSYAANTLASIINQNVYIPNYIGGLLDARVNQGQSIDASHAFARAFADSQQPQPGSPVFDGLFNAIRDIPIGDVRDVTIGEQTFEDVGGARFQDETGLWHAEGSYNFQELVDEVDIVAGANFRRYNLVSDGTLFALDNSGEEIDINEWGAYVQFSKSFLEDRLKLQASGRYDKNENFDGQFSPRGSAVFTIAGNHNIRGSFQRGFRIPTTQDQFIDLDVTTRRLIGSNRLLVDRFGLETNAVYNTADLNAIRAGLAPAESLEVETRVSDEFETEKINTFEIGYKGLLFDGKLLVDAYYYYSIYQDFIAEIDLSQAVSTADLQPRDGFDPVGGGFNPTSAEGQAAIIAQDIEGGRVQRFGFDINADGNVESQGWALGLEYSLPRGFRASGNVSFNELISQSDLTAQGFNAQFNTPRYRYNLGFSNREVIENIGFNVTWRWQQAFLWESAIGTGVIPEFGTLDAQISYKMPSLKSTFKIGGSNLLNERYTTSFANPRLGAIYYLQITFDQFLN
ncbi:MAG: TonB-dependent receptor [Bacteroidota bacterium]